MVDEVDEEGVIARSTADAPEIDGMVFVDSLTDYAPGTLLDVNITGSNEHDLFAEEI